MIQSLIMTSGIIILLMICWVIVQKWWGHQFSEELTDEDVLAGRPNCFNCACSTFCKERKSTINQQDVIS